MKVLFATFLVLAVGCSPAGDSTGPDGAAMSSEAAAMMKVAGGLAAASERGDHATVIDSFHDGVIQDLGGREKAIAAATTGMEFMKANGFKLESFELGTPGSLHTEGDYSFLCVPTEMKMTTPQGVNVSKGYLLGISSDGGKTWKLVDGFGMNDHLLDEVLPKLPDDLVLPEVQLAAE